VGGFASAAGAVPSQQLDVVQPQPVLTASQVVAPPLSAQVLERVLARVVERALMQALEQVLERTEATLPTWRLLRQRSRPTPYR
jgi:hypothetical protein